MRVGQNPNEARAARESTGAHHRRHGNAHSISGRLLCAKSARVETDAGSLHENREEAFNLYIFDIASCAAVREYLLQQNQDGYVPFLALCVENVGILWQPIFRAAPGDYIAYVGSVMYFRRGWLAVSVRVLETFSTARLVTGMPPRNSSMSRTRHTLEWARSAPDVSLDEGHLLKPDWIAAYCDGFGLDLEHYVARWNGQNDYRLTYRGERAYAGASSNQFLGRKSVLEAVAPPRPTEGVMHQSGTLFERLDAAGHLLCSRLTAFTSTIWATR